MTRSNRIVVEGGVCHVYNRLGRGERAFDQEAEAKFQVVSRGGGSEGPRKGKMTIRNRHSKEAGPRDGWSR
jgi:hypothetical protein